MTTQGAAFQRILTIPTEMKALEEGGQRFVTGLASSGRVDRQGEVVNQVALHRAFETAFARSGNRGLPYLKDHDTGKVIGKVIEFSLRDGSLWTKAQLRTAGTSEWADDVYAQLQDDIPTSQSIGFNPVPGPKGVWDFSASGEADDDGVWHWGGTDGGKSFDMLELSHVTIGANQDADAALGKSLGLDMRRPWAEQDDRIFCGVKLADLDDPEERRFFDDLIAADGRLQAVRNITAHWGKEGRALSPTILDALLSPMGIIADVIRAGRVLSDSNREKVTAAVGALQSVLQADDDSKGRKPAAMEDEPEKQALTEFGKLLLGQRE